jgi:hypothetical protein
LTVPNVLLTVPKTLFTVPNVFKSNPSAESGGNQCPFDLYETSYIGCILSECQFIRHLHGMLDISKVFFLCRMSQC